MNTKRVNKDAAQTTLEEMLEVDLEECEVTVCVASVRESGVLPEFQKLQLTDSLTDEFRAVGTRYLEKLRKEMTDGNQVLHSYDPGATLERHEVEYFELTADSLVTQQVDSLTSLAALNLFAVEEEFVQGLRFYVIIAQPKEGEPIYFFRSYTPKKELQRSPFIGAMLVKGHFDRVKEPFFLFDYNIDCMSRGDQMFIFSKDKFQKIFQFFEMLLASATATLALIKTQVPIANFDDFEESCKGHIQKLAKLNSIAQKPYFGTLSMVRMKKVIKEFGLPIKTTKLNGNEVLVFDTSEKWAILHLLDDYYLGSSMTGLKYGANSKRILT